MFDTRNNKEQEDYGFTQSVMQFVCSALNKALYKSPENDYAWEYVVLNNGYIEDSFLAASDKRAIETFMTEYAAA